jgi:hypothetical protein
MHVDAARRYRARLAGPADFRGRSSLSRGVAVSVRAFRQKTPNPKISVVAIESVSVIIYSKSYALPASLESPELQAAKAGMATYWPCAYAAASTRAQRQMLTSTDSPATR